MREIKEKFERVFLQEDADYYSIPPKALVNNMNSNTLDLVLKETNDNELLVDNENNQLNMKINGKLYKISELTEIT